MPRARRNRGRGALDEAMFTGRQHRSAPHEFVLEALAPIAPLTRQMFGCLAVYFEERIVLILRDRRESPADNGVWLATSAEHHEGLRREFPRMRSIQLFGKPVTHWQVLPADAPDFEATARRACELILMRDPRIGKVPKRRRLSRAFKEKSKQHGRSRQR